MKTSEKRLKLFEYLKNSIGNSGFIFLQETHSSIKDEQKWKGEVQGPLFSHGKLILADKKLAILEQNILKWWAKAVTKRGRF